MKQDIPSITGGQAFPGQIQNQCHKCMGNGEDHNGHSCMSCYGLGYEIEYVPGLTARMYLCAAALPRITTAIVSPRLLAEKCGEYADAIIAENREHLESLQSCNSLESNDT